MKAALDALGGPLPSASPAQAIGFAELEALRNYITTINQFQVSSLRLYYDEITNGFYHRKDEPKAGDFSKASTSTCVMSLLANDRWRSAPWGERSIELAEALLTTTWKSAGLLENNIFTTSFILEAADALASEGEYSAKAKERAAEAQSILEYGLADGAATVAGYPPSAYLTQLAVRVLQRRQAITSDLARSISDWAWHEVHRQLVLLAAKSKSADVYQLAYSLMLTARLGELGQATPDQALVLQLGLEKLFDEQLQDGSWPRSQALFHYPNVGTAHCYEYEMLVQLLSTTQLRDRLLVYLPNLSLASYALSHNAFELGDQALGWSSGHHPQFKGPESWSTASVFHFAHALGRLLAEAIRRWIFDHLDASYTPPHDPEADLSMFGGDFLDCNITVDQEIRSLREVLLDSFVKPVCSSVDDVKAGRSMSESTPMSAIFFGPPGTSKTELSRLIAEQIGWPRLVVDPSYFVRNGMDQIQSEASRLFNMLSVAEQVVVLLDEFDEMVRDRGSGADVLSRFLTTAMLPKLATINRSRRIVFIVATNYINHFDLAISRQGRFDLLLQVATPRTEEKLRHWVNMREKLETVGLLNDPEIDEQLGDLTYLEFKALAARLDRETEEEAIRLAIQGAHSRCTLLQPITADEQEKRTWKEVLTQQQNRVRLPKK